MTKKNQTPWAERFETNTETASTTSMRLVTAKEKEEKHRLHCYIPKSLYSKLLDKQYAEHKEKGERPSINSIVIEMLERDLVK